MITEITDPRFRVEIDWDGSSRSPERGIWRGQHTCVAEGFTMDDEPPVNAGDAIIRHQLKVEHFGVLRFGFLSLHCAGFPHSTMAQLTRHQDSAHLVQSGRYTSERFLKVADKKMNVDEVFYFRPVGVYQDRRGKRYEYTHQDRLDDMTWCEIACERYAKYIVNGFSEEHARALTIPYEFRQNFSIAGDLQAVFHWLDQRSKKDSQLEIQALAKMAAARLVEFAPSLGEWYMANRYGKARLAP